VIDRLTDQLETAVAGRPGPAAVALDLARFALGRAGDDWEPDLVVCDGAERLRAGDPVDLHGLSQRQFRRRFIRSFGYGPAFYRRIVRLDRASDLLDRHPDDSISQVAALAGYSDESHLWRDATELTGSTPARMRAV
jgi:AraC-like DNA-binding protein